MLCMTMQEKLSQFWLASMDHWSGRKPRGSGTREAITKTLPPVVLGMAAIALGVTLDVTLPRPDYRIVGLYGPIIATWVFIRISNNTALDLYEAQLERVPEQVRSVENSLDEAARKTELAMAATRKALAESHRLSEDLQARLEEQAQWVATLRAEEEAIRATTEMTNIQTEGMRVIVRNEVKPETRHLDRMARLYTVSGWVVAVLVIVFDRLIPRW